jgi:hypothetical protein
VFGNHENRDRECCSKTRLLRLAKYGALLAALALAAERSFRGVKGVSFQSPFEIPAFNRHVWDGGTAACRHRRRAKYARVCKHSNGGRK